MHDRRNLEITGRKLGRAWLRHPKLVTPAMAHARPQMVVYAAIWLTFNGHETKAIELATFLDCNA